MNSLNSPARPTFIYGTAWKEDQTTDLVEEALSAGFRAIDTANQRKHYHEAGAGVAISRWLRDAKVTREELFIQTKFTFVEGQDQRLPYDPSADHGTQVRQSFQSSREHLGVDFIDSLLLHGPRTRRGLTDEDREVWRAMESLQQDGKVGSIGVSNVTAGQLELLCGLAEVLPSSVQNRCYARTGWDRSVREVCRRRDIAYQGFSLLTANVAELGDERIRDIARRHGATIAQTVFAFARGIGMIPITGTTDPQHMHEDLGSLQIQLEPGELATIEGICW
jgi:diketogulonate reductase-like aldo/keto reductase